MGTTRFLTVLSFEVSEAEFGAFGGDEDLAIKGEDHGLVLHVDHTAHHVPSMPATPEQTAAHVQTVTLCTVHLKACNKTLRVRLKHMIKKKYVYLKSFDLNCILYTNHFSLNDLNFNFHLFSELQVFKKQGKGQVITTV